MRRHLPLPLLLVVAIALCIGVPGYSQTADEERLLVPLYVPEPIPGAHGSQWKTELTLLNMSSSPFVIGGVEVSQIGCTCPPSPVPSGITFSPRLTFWAKGSAGIYLHVPASRMNDVAVQLRVRDVSRPEISWGAQIPVVHENAAALLVELLDLPVNSEYRQDLRVYDFQAATGAEARVRVYGTTAGPYPQQQGPDPLLLDFTMPFSMPRGGGETMRHPSYAYIANLSSRSELAGHTKVRVSITSTSTESKIWAFASITNNDTQQVTIISPHPSR